MLLVYSAHFDGNCGEAQADIARREEAARRLLAYASDMEGPYSKSAKVVTVIAGEFKADPICYLGSSLRLIHQSPPIFQARGTEAKMCSS